ncbi:hypothetical protein GCM10008090_33590 [Arenicella chitinivorans]|uniref:Amidohydrolase-related domain-containing protein n=1 Tax=Arenicella chitinivorans TaxID=1329800 RepID=A0A918VT77_9GAMM|nr:amidohydrolase family protein [Arenicella chitinivorans]GHA20942.1 hypothetical protein GCM10008090_33590 [Arenicella chitinivorans]
MTETNLVIRNADVVVSNKRIASINGLVPSSATRIDGANQWLIPGLIDMHVHTNADINLRGNKPTAGPTIKFNMQDVMTTHIANGVTTIFELTGRVQHFAQRNAIVRGDIIGPRMAIARLLDGGDVGDPHSINSASDARQAVRSAKAEGYNFIKLYSRLSKDAFFAALDEANSHGMKVVGHIPDAFKGQTEEAFVPHFDLVAHAEEYSKQIRELPKTEEEADTFAKISKANNTWVIPNLIAITTIRDQVASIDAIRIMDRLKYVHPLIRDKWLNANNYQANASPEFLAYLNELVEFHKKLVVALHKAEVPMVVGTDAGVSGVMTGFAMHDELALLVEAGLSAEEVLIAATRKGAEWLSIDELVGTVEEGKYADLLLLDANPLDDISNTRRINGVFVDGRWLDKSKLSGMLTELAEWNQRTRDRYQWRNRREY